jgi:two-component system, OmpR family, sensor kinase
MAARDRYEATLLQTLERLLELPAADLKVALASACDLVAEALDADKVDAFLYDPTRDTLVALGTSNQPLSLLQKKLGLDVLQIANGGRVVYVYQTGETFHTGRLDRDAEELPGPKHALGIRSKVGVPLVVGETRRGMMMIASQKPDFFTKDDVRFAESVVRWVGAVAHRAELVEEIAKNAAEQGRRAVADELITVLAHDLRNFLSPIHLRVSMMRRRSEHDRREADLADADAALKGIARLSTLISDMLDVARIDQGVFKMDIEPIALTQLIEEVASPLSTPQHRVRVKPSDRDDIVVAADRARVRQCVENLLSNAVKHSPREAPVTVLIGRQTEEEGEFAVVEVIDEGPGIPADILPRIFERFVTGKKDSNSGLGLGLYLAKRIAVMHRGDLSVSSNPGKGAQFVLRLPCYREP